MKASIRMSRLKVEAPLAVYWNDKADLAAKVDYTDQFIQDLDCAAVYQEEIHIPVFELLDESDGDESQSADRPFTLPRDYLAFDPTAAAMELSHQHNEYDVDERDEVFLRAIRREMALAANGDADTDCHSSESPSSKSKGKNKKEARQPIAEEKQAQMEQDSPKPVNAYALKSGAPFELTDDVFEKIIDYLEKESFRLNEHAQMAFDSHAFHSNGDLGSKWKSKLYSPCKREPDQHGHGHGRVLGSNLLHAATTRLEEGLLAREAAYPLSPARHGPLATATTVGGNQNQSAGVLAAMNASGAAHVPTMEKASSSDDDDVPCCICGEGDSEEGNLIVFCESCAIAVHQRCQSLPVIPEDAWYCPRCVHLKKYPKVNEASIKCCQCQQGGGSMKQVANRKGLWIHVSCAIFLSCEIHISKRTGEITMEDSHANNKRHALTCNLCHVAGGCVQCCHKACFVAYHSTCAQLALQYAVIVWNTDADSDKLVKSTFTLCDRHTEKARENESNIILQKEAKTVVAPIGQFLGDSDTRKAVQAIIKSKIPPLVFEAIGNYWREKRLKANNGRSPLIRRLLIETEDEKQKQRLVEKKERRITLLPGTKEEKYQHLLRIRKDFEHARILLDLIRRREAVKLETVRLYQAATRHFYLSLPLRRVFVRQHRDFFDSEIVGPEKSEKPKNGEKKELATTKKAVSKTKSKGKGKKEIEAPKEPQPTAEEIVEEMQVEGAGEEVGQAEERIKKEEDEVRSSDDSFAKFRPTPCYHTTVTKALNKQAMRIDPGPERQKMLVERELARLQQRFILADTLQPHQPRDALQQQSLQYPISTHVNASGFVTPQSQHYQPSPVPLSPFAATPRVYHVLPEDNPNYVDEELKVVLQQKKNKRVYQPSPDDLANIRKIDSHYPTKSPGDRRKQQPLSPTPTHSNGLRLSPSVSSASRLSPSSASKSRHAKSPATTTTRSSLNSSGGRMQSVASRKLPFPSKSEESEEANENGEQQHHLPEMAVEQQEFANQEKAESGEVGDETEQQYGATTAPKLAATAAKAKSRSKSSPSKKKRRRDTNETNNHKPNSNNNSPSSNNTNNHTNGNKHRKIENNRSLQEFFAPPSNPTNTQNGRHVTTTAQSPSSSLSHPKIYGKASPSSKNSNTNNSNNTNNNNNNNMRIDEIFRPLSSFGWQKLPNSAKSHGATANHSCSDNDSVQSADEHQSGCEID